MSDDEKKEQAKGIRVTGITPEHMAKFGGEEGLKAAMLKKVHLECLPVTNERNLQMPVTNERNLQMSMTAWPTCNPTWEGHIYDGSDYNTKPLVSASLSFDNNAPYSGGIHETLTRFDVWEQVRVHRDAEVTDAEHGDIVLLIKEQLAANVGAVLAKTYHFYPQLECRAEVQALVESGRSYEAFVKIAAEVPQSTAWSTEKSVGRTDAKGVFAWHPKTFGIEWNLGVGYIILNEAMRRHLEGHSTL